MTIFLSYARADSKRALRLAADLRRLGIHLWIDQVDIEPGESWDSVVQAKLLESDVVVVLLSRAAVTSANVLDEVAFALDSRKRLVPIVLEQCDRPLRLARVQHVAIDSGIDEIAKAIVGGKSAKSQPNGRSPEPERSKPETRADLRAINSRIKLPGFLLLLASLAGSSALLFLYASDTQSPSGAAPAASAPLTVAATPPNPTSPQADPKFPSTTDARLTDKESKAAASSPGIAQSSRFAGLWDYDGPAHGGNWVRQLNANGTFYNYGGKYPWDVEGPRVSLVHQNWREDGQLQGDVIRGTGRFTGDDKARRSFSMPPTWTWTMRRHDPSLKQPGPPVEVTVVKTTCTDLSDGGTEVTLHGTAASPIGSLLRARTQYGRRPSAASCGIWDTTMQEHFGESSPACRRRADQAPNSQWAFTFRVDDEFDPARRSLRVSVHGVEVIPSSLPTTKSLVELDAKCP